MIDIKNLSLQYGSKVLFESVNLKINKNDRIALVGDNGTGKSTFLKLLCGLEEPDKGEIHFQKGIKIAYLSQEFTSMKGKTLFDEVKDSLTEIKGIEFQEKEIHTELEKTDSEEKSLELSHKLDELELLKEKYDYYGIESKIKKVLEGLGFRESEFGKLTEEFSGGWQMRIELAKILSDFNDVILLDEPTNHLDIESLRWLVSFLEAYKGTLIIVSHDRYFLDRLTDRTLEIFNSKLSFFNGNLSSYLQFKKEREEQLEHDYIQQQKKIKETERFIERFRYKDSKAKQVQSRIKQLEKMDRVELENFSSKKIRLKFPEPPRAAAVPIEIKSLSKRYDDNQVLENINLQILRGEKIAFLGPNGAGKTTLSKLIAGKTELSEGEIILGANTEVAYYAQEVAENLDPEKDLIETLDEVASDYNIGQLRSLLGSFLFSNDDVFKKVKVLSGGEKSRLALAKIMLMKSNVLILDEPTNHLDFNSKEVLQSALIDYKGTLIIVSHDIEFIRPIINKVYEIKNKKVRFFEGGIDYYLQKTGDEEDFQTDFSRISKPANNKKEQKRIEAELRQKKYNATKDIIKKINSLESIVEELEEKKTELELDLGDESVFSNPEKLKETNLEYKNVKEELEKRLEEWTSLSEELEKIEAEFESNQK